MDLSKMVKWLIDEKKMSSRSAKDVISRCGRVCKMLNSDTINDNSLVVLQQNEQFKESSIFIKSQLKRAVTLYIEHINKYEKE